MKYFSLLTLFSLLQQTENLIFEVAQDFSFHFKLAHESDLSFELTHASDLPFRFAKSLGPPIKLKQGACSPDKFTQVSDPLYDTAEAADYIGVKENTLTVWRCIGRYGIEYIKVGRLVKYRKSALDAFLYRRTRGGMVS